ncbi:MAG: glycolate oxidase subunit GlcF [Alphaproteobacteria bacterium]
MQTNFSLAQLADPEIAEANAILRSCVHCGFCTATCPTYVLLGDELDSPRGRIYQIKDMLETRRPAPEPVVTHIDRCLSCLSCMTTCPSGVHYMHLVDLARDYIRRTHVRPLADRLLRRVLATVLPRPGLFRLALFGAMLARPFARVLPRRPRGMVRFAPKHPVPPMATDRPGVHPALGPRRGRVALLAGCAQQVLAPQINAATIRLLNRHGIEVVVSPDTGCCGALVLHMGEVPAARSQAARNIRAWARELDRGALDAVVVSASGCGTTVKDYGHLFRTDPDLAEDAARVGAATRDVTEYLDAIGLNPPRRFVDLIVAYHSACSLQHGQKVAALPKQLLEQAGFEVRDPAEGHLCCGSAGTYNLLQPDIANRLRERKTANIEATGAAAVAAGNLGCMAQIASGTALPVLHTVELLDWATGGPKPAALE